jgi:hypothetical protein
MEGITLLTMAIFRNYGFVSSILFLDGQSPILLVEIHMFELA